WFSVRLPGLSTPDWRGLDIDGIEVLQAARHRRKLRRGVLKANRFRIRLRDVRGDLTALDGCLHRVRQRGFPNYFGEQRFGRAYHNLVEAQRLFEKGVKGLKRHKRGLYLSAARSMLFNEVLARRIEAANWDQPLAGDLVMLEGTHSRFPVETPDAALLERAGDLDLHPTGPLYGRGDLETGGAPALLETAVAERFATWIEGLCRFGLKQERRALRSTARDLEWQLEDDTLLLSFTLAPGSYATVLLRELASVVEPQRGP
ncbi:MAG TPA: tRNA pseudouridine(13) synthase TruD, partial [Chromatiales bacterium]|nr:tRNA pseudouridine(13) synthase TruD [Chromatiales bacterium]